MDQKEWESRWQQRRIGFHMDRVHPDLINHQERFLGSQSHRVAVPLCGKSHDLRWLAERGHEVVGVEVVQDAISEFFSDNKLTIQPSAGLFGPEWKANGITIIQGDWFEVGPKLEGITRVWDRAALVAITPDRRTEYARIYKKMLSEGAQVLLNTFSYDQALMQGPPWSVPESMVRQLLPDHHIDVVSDREAIDDNPRWRESGHKTWQATLLYIQ